MKRDSSHASHYSKSDTITPLAGWKNQERCEVCGIENNWKREVFEEGFKVLPHTLLTFFCHRFLQIEIRSPEFSIRSFKKEVFYLLKTMTMKLICNSFDLSSEMIRLLPSSKRRYIQFFWISWSNICFWIFLINYWKFGLQMCEDAADVDVNIRFATFKFCNRRIL